MPMPILPVGSIFQKRLQKGIVETKQKEKDNEYQGAYFDGLSGLSAEGREAWEKKYLNEISGRSDAEKDEIFRNTVFKDMFANSDKPEDQEIWNNRKNLSLADRDIFFARKAVEEDLDAQSNAKETPLSLMETVLEPEKTAEKFYAKTGKTLRDAATDYLSGVSQDVAAAYRAQVDNMDSNSRDNLADNFDTMSREAVPMYKEYIGTDKLPLDKNQIAQIAADYSAWENVGGSNFAYRMLNKTYQDIIAKNQSIWEKTVNTGAQFVDSGAGMIIRAAGMAGALAGIGLDEDENYWDHVLDNSVTRYGDRVATTQSWDTARQQYLEENGMQDNPILNTTEQQNSIISWNTPFEVLGQYGFTAASTLLSFGGSAALEGAVKTAGWAGKAASGAKGLNTTAKGVKFAQGLIRAKDIGNILVAGGIGAVEGGMNAVGTRDKVLKDLNADIDKDYNTAIDSSIDAFVAEKPQDAIQMLLQAGLARPEEVADVNRIDPNAVAQALKSDEGVRENFGRSISPEFDERRQKAEESARSAMMVDFVGNSIINGFINTTLQATLNAPSIQRSLRKYGLQKAPIDDLGVDIVKGSDNAWKAAAKRFTRWDAVKNRFKEAWGEGVEEYTQDISGAFGEGYGKDKMSQYIDFKYGESAGSDAFEEDVYRNIMTGLQYAGQAAVSQESIKDGLYGILSTAVGGPNANINNRGSKERQKGESGFAYAKRRSPIAWRSAFGPLFNNEAAEVNKQRDETAQRINDFFADEEKQNLFFDLESSTNWMRAARQAVQSGDEKAIRDARVAQMVNNVFAANELKGSAYYDAIEANMKARAAFKAENLNDANSTESKAVDQYIADTQNRGENITREEALDAIVKSSQDMLSMMEKVDEETASVEKLFGSEMDRDTKEALVYARISAADAKERMGSIDNELNEVKAALNERDDTNETSGLGRRSRRLIAQYGSLGEAVKALAKAEEEKAQLDAGIAELEDEIKADVNANAAVKNGREARQSIQESIQEKRDILRVAKEDAKNRKRDIETAKRDIERYRREAPKETKVTTDEEGNEITSEILSGREVLSAKEIMELNPVDRARMLNPENRNDYSDAQQAEIEKAQAVGNETLDGFTSKVVDRGKLESNYNGMVRTMLKMSQEPQTFARYQQAVKSRKQRALLNKKYDYLRDYDNTKTYGEFAREISRIFSEEPEADRQAATRVLNSANSAYFARYKESNNTLQSVYSRLGKNEAFNKLDEGDKNLFTNTLEYLVERGVDIEDNNAVVDALSAMEEDPNNPGVQVESFMKYIDEVNSKVSDAEKTGNVATGNAIQIFKDVMSSLRNEAQEQQANSRPVEVAETTPAQSAPATTPTPQPAPGIFGSGAYDSPDGGRPEGSDDVQGGTPQPITPTPTGPQPTPTGGNATVEAYRNSSGDTVAKAAETALTTIDNTPEHAATDKAKAAAKAKIDKLKDYAFESVEDFADSILKEANALDMTGDADNQATAGVLRRAASTVRNQSNRKPKVTAQPVTNLTGLAASRYNFASQVGGNINPNSSTIGTINIQSQKRNHPDGAFAKFIDKYKIEEFLSDPQALTGERRTIRFIVDSQLAADTKASMEANNVVYTTADIPVVPVVEVKEKSDHVIVINDNGTEKYYQPIGILPATYNIYTSGANRLGKLRDLANNQDLNQLIKDENGNVVSTTAIGHVTATPPAHLQENQSVVHIGMSSLNANEKAEMQGKSKEEARKTAAYQRLKDRFMNHLSVRTNKYGSPELYYTTSNLKNDGNESGFIVTRTPVHKSVDKNSKETIVNLFREGKIAEALAANSRLKRFASEFKDFFSKNALGANLFVPDGKGGYTLSKEGQKSLDDFATRLGDRLRNYLVLPNKLDGGPVRYRLTPLYTTDANGAQQISRDANGSPMFTLEASNDVFSIALANVSSNTANDEAAFYTLRNLILDEQNNPRMRSDKESFMVWQVPYADVQKMDSNVHAKDNISDIYDDGILEASVASFDYSVNSVQFNAPFTMEGQPTYVVPTVANGDNASGQKDTTVATTPSGQTFDGQSGVPLSGPTAKPETPVSPAARVAGEIVENSKHVALSEDGSVYVDDRTGVTYARVTSIIAADREADERFDPNSPWVMPSTNIGTGVDELVRDFFGNNLKDTGSYPNTTKEQVEAFVEQLKGLKNQLTAAGLTVIPRDVVVTGTLNATDAQGKVHQVRVAGTLDLLAYDAEGNFYVFDMKTFRTSIDDHKKEKYARQLSLYKKFLENTYGIKVKDLKIIPIKVEYPKPGQVTYGLAEGKPNQLTANGKEYTSAKPKLHAMIPLNYHEPDISFDKLTDSEKEMFRDAVETQTGNTLDEGETKITPAPAETPEIDPLTGMPMVGYKNPLIPENDAPEAGKGKAFVVRDLRWGVWEGLTKDEINTLKVQLVKLGYTAEDWDSSDIDLRPSDAEKEQAIKCILGIK